MGNCEVVINRSQEFDDELQHYKYIKREKVNGKWRYYYDQAEIDAAKAKLNAAANTAVTEGLRTSQDVKYAAKDAKYKHEMDKAKKTNDFGKIASNYAKQKVNNVLRKLNRYGEGTLDDRLIQASKKGRDAVRKRLNIK